MLRIQNTRLVAGSALFLLGLAAGFGLSVRSATLRTPSIKTILENNRVLVREVVYEKGARRPTHVRQNDQVIVFLNAADYEVVYPDGKRQTKSRQAGETIWHSRGETAPTLTNTGADRYRTIVVDLK